jgi:WD40 repeat protein
LFWHPFKNYLLSGSDDRTIIVWQIDIWNIFLP